MSRFDYVKYDDTAVQIQNVFKKQCQELENSINAIGGILDPLTDKSKLARAKSLALTKLEEVYMWIGKAVRDDQIARNGAAELQEDRTKS